MRTDRLIAVAGMMLAAACAFGGIGIGQEGGRFTKVVSVNASGNRGSVLDRIDARQTSWSWLYSGKAPLKYKLLDLTNEQHAAVEEITLEAKDAWRELQRGTMRSYKENKDRSVFKQQRERMRELRETYQTRMTDVLTEEQRDALKKIEELSAERQAKIAEIYKETQAKVKELRASYDEKLLGLLTPEQKKCLKDLLNPSRPPKRRQTDPGGGYEAF